MRRFSERRFTASRAPSFSARGVDEAFEKFTEVIPEPGITLELQRVGHLVQHDPEPQSVYRNPDPAGGGDYVAVEEEHLARLLYAPAG